MSKSVVLFTLCAVFVIVSTAPGHSNREKRALENGWPTIYNTSTYVTEIENRFRRQAWGATPAGNRNSQVKTNDLKTDNRNNYAINDQWESTSLDSAESFPREPQAYESSPSYDRNPPPPPPDEYTYEYDKRPPPRHPPPPPPPPPRHDRGPPSYDRSHLYYDDRGYHGYDDRPPPPPPRDHEGKPPYDRGPPLKAYYYSSDYERKPPPPPDRGPPHERSTSHFDRRSTSYEKDDYWGYHRDNHPPPPPPNHDGPPRLPPDHYGHPPPPPPDHHRHPPPPPPDYHRHPPPPPPDHHRPPPPPPPDYHRHPPPPPPDHHRRPPPPPPDHYRPSPPPPPPDHYGHPPPHDRGPPTDHYWKPPSPPPHTGPPPDHYGHPHDRGPPRTSDSFGRTLPSEYYPTSHRQSSEIKQPSSHSLFNLGSKRGSSADFSGPLNEKLSINSGNGETTSENLPNLPTSDQTLSSPPRDNIDIRSITEREFSIDTRLSFQDVPKSNGSLIQESSKSKYPLFQVIPVTPES